MLLAPKDLPGRHFYGDDVRSKLPLACQRPLAGAIFLSFSGCDRSREVMDLKELLLLIFAGRAGFYRRILFLAGRVTV